jgi:hypothetical protein
VRMLGQPNCSAMGSFAALLATTRSLASQAHAYLYASGAVLPRPRGRERYTQDSLKTRLPSQFSDSSALHLSVPITGRKS